MPAENSQSSARAAGWTDDGDPRGPESPLGSWRALLDRRKAPKWDHFSWLTVRALFESVNDQLAKLDLDLVLERRPRWTAAQRSANVNERFGPDFVVDRSGDTRFFLIGDTGEQDASQYAVAPVFTGAANGAEGDEKTQFAVIVSDVVYPAGDVNEYVNAFYIPYEAYPSPIYALPGNHDWYDGLNGFMYHFCGADPLPVERYRASSFRPGKRFLAWLWRRSSVPERNQLAGWRSSRPGSPDGLPGIQPAPYFAIDTGDLLIVSIDTGVTGEIDDEQGEWLLRISRRPQHKVLLTGKPIYVDNEYHPCRIRWSRDDRRREFATVDDVVRRREFGYLAAIGGDVHNYQRYPIRITEGEGRDLLYLVSGGGGAYLSPTHRIPRVGSGPPRPVPDQDDTQWPAATEMPREPGAGDDEPPRRAFRCYPRRGDSLAYAGRTAVPRLFSLLIGGVAAFCAASYLFTGAAPISPLARIGTLAFYLGVVAGVALGLAVARVWRKPPAGAVRTSARFATIVLLGLFGLLLSTWIVDLIACEALLASGQFWIAFGISFAVPVLLLAGAIVAYELRGSLPSAPADLLPGLTTAAALAILADGLELGDAPAWFVSLALGAAVVAAITAGTRALRAREDRRRHAAEREGKWPGRGPWQEFALERLLVAAPPLLLCVALATELDTDWLAAVMLSSAAAFAVALGLIDFLVRPGFADDRTPPWPWSLTYDVSRFVAIAAWVGAALSAAGELGPGWVAYGMLTAAAGLVLVATMAGLGLLFGGSPLKSAGIVLGGAVVLLAVALLDPPVLVLAVLSALLVLLTLRVFSPLRAGNLNADRAERFAAAGLGTQPRRPEAGEPAGGELVVSQLLQGQRISGPSTVARALSELADADRPPFFKHLLRCDMLASSGGPPGLDRTLRIRCLGVTGYADGEADPPCEDEIEIHFASSGLYPTSGSPPPPQIVLAP